MKEKILNFIRSWEPISDRIIVLPEEQQKETASGIITSDTKQGEDKRIVGRVLSVGKGRYAENGKRIPMENKVDDMVIFGKYAGEDFLIGEDLSINKYNGIKRDDEVLITIVRQDSLLSSITL